MRTMEVIEKLAMSNPQALDNPRSQQLLDILRSGDEKRGIEAANSILKDLGIDRNAGINQATSGITAMLQGRFGRGKWS